MELTKDMYEYLINFVDDKTVLNMLSVNKKFNDPVFFEKIMRKRYPTIIRYNNKNWKQLYIETIYWVSRLKEEFNFEPVPYIDPKIVYSELKNTFVNFLLKKENILRKSLFRSIRRKDLNSIKKLIERGVVLSQINTFKPEDLKFLLENVDIKNLNLEIILKNAKRRKHYEIVSYLETLINKK